ncbi:L-tyrosine/L-tryptophan isonitrile synthase family protein [Wenjunlia tyrosinilytica]|uniref:Siderophore biosynthesis-related protein n=1 Tax=Wenjunlia tyrosinilytica TaxID=1544741 RepID=A0A918DYC6_9ACTN|nr:isocyanide synthase family protein [Wenjunlia tyrosinilytica]GGO88618.1 siderophore biosynthesis-related protein [Wenjunlia tyrosinilytica]
MAVVDTAVVAERILASVMRYQRSTGDGDCGGRGMCPACAGAHLPNVVGRVRLGLPVELALPGFPAKSPNRAKVLGAAPDLAERLSLRFLQRLCEEIAGFYEPGAEIVICSDGRVFGDFIGVTDEDIGLYQDGIRQLIADLGADCLRLFNLDDEYRDVPHETMRRRLIERYGEPLDRLREEVRAGGEPQRLYLGVTRFLVEDADTPEYTGSRAALQRECRERAYGVFQRSKAWGGLVADRFPEAVRLSIHPQNCGSPKLGIHLLETADGWLTPWHGVAVEIAGRYVLMKRHQAEAIGARLVLTPGGEPSHFVAPDDAVPPPSLGAGPRVSGGGSETTTSGGAAS